MLIKNNLDQEKSKYYLALVNNIMLSAFVVLVIIGSYIEQIPIYMSKARFTEVLYLIPAIQSDLIADYNSLGHWPKEKLLRDNSDDSYSIIDNIRFDGIGTINIYFKDSNENFSNKVLSFVAHAHPHNKLNTITWTCGYGLPLDGFIPLSQNNTTIASPLLPRFCKAINNGELIISSFKQGQEI